MTNQFMHNTMLELLKSLDRATLSADSSLPITLSILILDLVETANTLYYYNNSGKTLKTSQELIQWMLNYGKISKDHIPNKFSNQPEYKDAMKFYRTLYILRNKVCHCPTERKVLVTTFNQLDRKVYDYLTYYMKWLLEWYSDTEGIQVKYDYITKIELLSKKIINQIVLSNT